MICGARPHADDERTCEAVGDHAMHQVSGVAIDKFGEHAWSLRWHDGSYGAVPASGQKERSDG